MGQCLVTFAGVDNTRGHSVYSPYGVKSQEVITSGTAAASTITADAGDYARIVNNSDTLIWATVGSAPTAAVGTTYAIGARTSIDLGPLAAGSKVSVIDDS